MKIKLKKLGKIITGNTPKKSDKQNYTFNDICFVKPSDISDDVITKITNTEHYISNYATNTARLAPKDSVLVTCIGIIGKVAILEKNSAFNQQINAIIPYKDKVLSNYLAYNLFYRKNYMQQKANAPVVPIINKTQFEDLEITFHSLEEQKKIANTLDKVTNLIELRKKQLEKLDIFSKALFVEMFGSQNNNPYNFDKGKIKDIVTDVKYGTSSPATDNGKYPYLRMGNITYDGYLDLTDLKYINIKDNEYDKYIVKKGDVLFNRTNSKELVGKTCVFNLDEPMVIAGYIIRIRTKRNILPEYLSAVLNSSYGKQTLYNMCKSIVGQANINAKELQDISLLIPPIELQNQFAKRIEQINKIKLSIQDSLNKLETLKKSLMQEYFS